MMISNIFFKNILDRYNILKIASRHEKVKTWVYVSIEADELSDVWMAGWICRFVLTPMLLVANLAIMKLCKNPGKMTEILAHMGNSSENTPQQELSNEYQHDIV